MATITGQEIREDLIRYGIILLLSRATATSGGSNRIRDSVNLDSDALSPTAFEDCWVRMTSGNRNGEIARVDYLDQVNGDLYVTPSFTGTTLNAETYEIYRPGVHPDDVDRARDEALTSVCSQWALQPLSELTNADFEDTLGSTWTGTSASLAIQTDLSFPVTQVGRNALRVTNSAANGFAQSTGLFGRPSQTFYIYVPVSTRSGTSEIIVRDVTNGANISLSGTVTSTGRGWTALEVTGQVPSNGNEIAVRLQGQESTAIIDWGPVQFRWQNQRAIALPERVVSRDDIGRIYRRNIYERRGTHDSWGEGDLEEVPSVQRTQKHDVVFLQFPYENPMWDTPYYYQERIFYGALSAGYFTAAQRIVGDDATTRCERDYAAAAAARILAEWYARKQPWAEEFWSGIYAQAERRLLVEEQRHGPPTEPVATRDRSIFVPNMNV